jgi:hypothetical protein
MKKLRKAAKSAPATGQSGMLGNILRDGFYVTPWGEVERCFVITDHVNPAVMSIIRGKCGNEISLEFKDSLKPRRSKCCSVESRYVFFGEASQDTVKERTESWPGAVLDAVPFGDTNAKSLKELTVLLGCKRQHLKGPLNNVKHFVRNGFEVFYRDESTETLGL